MNMSTSATPALSHPERHPPGLFLLFFAEMWERFSFYGMRALLVLYMIKGFMKADDGTAYAIYGAYGALVYATPYLGGILADRVLGSRLAVIWGGLLMAAGHLVLAVEHEWAFFTALGLLICGNGFFKPNISTMVGALYPARSGKRDAGFTIFYMGINLGAALAPLVCGYVGETYGWHYGFGLATVGMLTGVVTFVAPAGLARFLIALATLAVVVTMVFTARGNTMQLLLNAPIALALLVAGLVSMVQLGRGGVPHDVGRPPANELGRSKAIRVGIMVATLAAVPVFALLCSKTTAATIVLNGVGLLAFGSLAVVAARSSKVECQRLIVVLVLCFFSLLFWAFFEQAGSSVNNFTDRNVDRVVNDTPVKAGQMFESVPVTQEFLGQTINGHTWTLVEVDAAEKARMNAETLREATAEKAQLEAAKQPVPESLNAAIAEASKPPETPLPEYARSGYASFEATPDNERLGLAVGGEVIKASVFQAANPTFILLFGLPFSLLWGWLGVRGRDPSAPFKFGLGLIQLAAGFACLWMGALSADTNGMVAMGWLLMGYLLQTTGELCLSPVGLSLVTKLSPKRVVATIMGAWFLATSFSHLLAAGIAKFTAPPAENAGSLGPVETLALYQDVFGYIAVAALASGLLALAVSPILKRMMHLDTLGQDESPSHG
jgi:proton-dependent oligopeptide transporter, POT family